MKKILSLILIATMIFTLVSCGGSDDADIDADKSSTGATEASGKWTEPESADVVMQLLKPNFFIVGVCDGVANITEVDQDTGTWSGVGIGVAEKFAEDFFGGTDKLSYVKIEDENAKETMVANKSIDMLITSVSGSESPGDDVEASIPFYTADGKECVFIVLKENDKLIEYINAKLSEWEKDGTLKNLQKENGL